MNKILLLIIILLALIYWAMVKQCDDIKHMADVNHFNAEVRATRYTKWAVYQEPELPDDFYAMLRVRELDKLRKAGGL
jgi:hypothetical protein